MMTEKLAPPALRFANESLIKGLKPTKRKRDAAMIGPPKYARIDREAYFTPPWCTEALVRALGGSNGIFSRKIWEPACGDGNISKVLKAAGYDVYSTDIVEHKEKYADKIIDFLEESWYDIDYDIITNPPYNVSLRFLKNALKITEKNKRVVAFLLRNEWDCAATRTWLFQDNPAFSHKIVLTKRPRWIADTKISPRHNYSWFVWNWGKDPAANPTLLYLQ
jgi:hypothetical protein